MEATLSSSVQLSDFVRVFEVTSDKREKLGEEYKGADFSEVSSDPLYIMEDYVAHIEAPVSWLSLVVRRIVDSVLPSEINIDDSDRCWLTPEAASAGLTFFRATCDLLPSEPQLTGTHSGELVAEFESAAVRLTSVLSEHRTLLFGYRKSSDEAPKEIEIKRGSNRLRDDVRAFIVSLARGADGEALAT